MNVVNATEYLAGLGVSTDDARAFLLNNYEFNLKLIYDTCAKYGVNNSMIAEILSKDFTGLTGDDVSSFFDWNGLTGADLGLNTINGTTGDNTLTGTTQNDTMFALEGNDTLFSSAGTDIMRGGTGSDTFVINGTGKKTILEKDGVSSNDTLDLSASPETSGANLDLSAGGTVGVATTIKLGVEEETAPTGVLNNNIMMILDSSGSMSGSRMSDAKAAATDLLSAYDQAGNAAVRLVDFDDSATSTFDNKNLWMSTDDAKSLIANQFYASGSTNYSQAIDVAQTAYLSYNDTIYIPNGTDTIFFLSDGKPYPGVYSSQQVEWENFLIDNQITAYSIGFGSLSSSDIAYLEPIAFDATKVVDSNGDGKIDSSDDHTPGQIAPSIASNSSSLSETLLSSAKINTDIMESVVGTNYDDILKGNTLNNSINGALGNDTLSGLAGEDTLIGGSGSDKFVFNSFSEGKDTIQDFVSGVDKIVLKGSGFHNSLLPNTDIMVEVGYEAYPSGISNTNPTKDLFLQIIFTGTKADGTSGTFDSGYLITSADTTDSYVDTYTGLKNLLDSKLDAAGFSNLEIKLGSSISSITTAAGEKTLEGIGYQIIISDPDGNAVTSLASGSGMIASVASSDVASNIYSYNPLQTSGLSSRVTFDATSATNSDYEFSYNTTTGDLSFDSDGSATGADFVTIATLTGAPTFAATDFDII